MSPSEDVKRLRQLLEINRLIVSTLDPDRVLPLVVYKTAALIGADQCVLLLADAGGSATVAAAWEVGEAQMAGFSTLLTSGSTSRSDSSWTAARATSWSRCRWWPAA